MLKVNVVGTFTVTQLLLPLLKKGHKKTIINISSNAASLSQNFSNIRQPGVSDASLALSYRVAKVGVNMGKPPLQAVESSHVPAVVTYSGIQLLWFELAACLQAVILSHAHNWFRHALALTAVQGGLQYTACAPCGSAILVFGAWLKFECCSYILLLQLFGCVCMPTCLARLRHSSSRHSHLLSSFMQRRLSSPMSSRAKASPL